MEKELYHHGILGMKWGVRRYQNEDGTLTEAGKKRYGEGNSESSTSKSSKSSSKKSSTKQLSDLSDAELKERISRLQLERQYKDLASNKEKAKVSVGKKFLSKSLSMSGQILEQSVKNIGTQAVTYGLGRLVNDKFYEKAGENIVNPKKGQKDK